MFKHHCQHFIVHLFVDGINKIWHITNKFHSNPISIYQSHSTRKYNFEFRINTIASFSFFFVSAHSSVFHLYEIQNLINIYQFVHAMATATATLFYPIYLFIYSAINAQHHHRINKIKFTAYPTCFHMLYEWNRFYSNFFIVCPMSLFILSFFLSLSE